MSSHTRLARIEYKLKKLQTNNKSSLKPIDFHDWFEMAEKVLVRCGTKVVNFKPYDYQLSTIDLIAKNKVSLVVKGRQLGITQIVATYFLYRAITEPSFTGVIISKTGNDTGIIALRIKEIANQLSDYFKLSSDSLLHLKIIGGGQIFFRNSKVDACRGIDSVTAILFDEAGFIKDIDLIYSASSPALSLAGDDARIIFVSTPNGLEGNFFGEFLLSNAGDRDPLEICEKIRQKELKPFYSYIDDVGCAKAFVHWRSHPVYRLRDNYIEDMARELNQPISTVQQEYDLAFNLVEESVFTLSEIDNCRVDHLPEIDNSIYFAGCDASYVKDRDYFVFPVFKECYKDDGTTFIELVDVYRSNQGTVDTHTLYVTDMIRKYGIHAVGIETNSIGQIVYERLALQNRDVDFTKILTTNTTKTIMIERLKYFMSVGRIKWNTQKFKVLTKELLNFRSSDGVLKASGKGNDDFVMAIAFAVQIWSEKSDGSKFI